jgi:hypothetical protein
MALPVTWLNINGRNDNKNNIINWTVASEENNDYYTIEVSTNGNSFTGIGKVKGAGTTNSEQRYSFTHHNVTERVFFYRIKQVDIDGKFSYSKIVKVVTDNFMEKGITVLNNPVRDQLAVSIVASRSFAGIIDISDIAGKAICRKNLHLNAGNNIIDIGSFRHAAGIYYLVFSDANGKRHVSTFIKK